MPASILHSALSVDEVARIMDRSRHAREARRRRRSDRGSSNDPPLRSSRLADFARLTQIYFLDTAPPLRRSATLTRHEQRQLGAVVERMLFDAPADAKRVFTAVGEALLDRAPALKGHR